MGIEQKITDLQRTSAEQTAASQALSQEVAGKMGEIDKKTEDFKEEARNLAVDSLGDLFRCHIGLSRAPLERITPSPSDDVGVLVNTALSKGAKSIEVNWPADGQERNWNTYVSLPVGVTISISGPNSTVGSLGGKVRADRECWKKGGDGGCSELGSPLVFRNLQVSSKLTPHNDHFKIYEYSSLIGCAGNNIVKFGKGCYLHDEGGMLMSPSSGGLIKVAAYSYGTPSYIVGGGYGCKFYISSALVNQLGGSSDFYVRLFKANFVKTTSDGPELLVNKGFKRLKNEGLNVPSELLNVQPWEVLLEHSDLNDNKHGGYGRSFYANTRGLNTQADRPRLLLRNSWSFSGGIASIQCLSGFGEVAPTGLHQIGVTTEYRMSF
ncbi:hypothetical protein [Vibrio splendidus]|uniref:hypothetical protein n=1 Tax=Vibrio splendidus TaxID=29497 RepID=UPI0000670DEF|nr:hypothetical protein [Vibrio splendidus]EAP93451.1 hypothetical protein V12B01_24019 [Vibrio splendidus 12B01]